MNKNIDTLIFDLDGTLLDTLSGIHSAFNYALKQQGYKTHTLEEVRGFVGSGIKKAFERALECSLEDGEAESLINIFKDYYDGHLYEHTKPYNGIMEMLGALKQINFKTAVVSNKYDDAVQELCRHYFTGYIDAAAGESAETRRKPHTDGIIKMIGALGSKLDNTLFIGDSEIDLYAAANANIPCISVLWGFKDRAFLEKYGAKFFAEEPSDILKIISEINFLR